MLKELEKFQDIPLIGTGGWNSFDAATDIDNIELADVQNMIYDNGLSPRSGSKMLYEKPDGESGDPLQLMIAHTSDGIRYVIAIYANHFYVRHPTNDEWVRINQTYVPTQTDLRYGWQNWNNGRGDDRLYFCNGVDDFGRWDMCVDQADGAQLAGAATLLLDDATRFPASGTVVIRTNGSEFTEAYTSKTDNTLNLTGTLSQNVANEASVVMDVVQKGSMEIGKVVAKHGGRLFAMNYYGGETTVWYSVLHDPEDFTAGSDVADGGTEVIADGNGEIVGGHDFGEFFVIEKQDSFHTFKFHIAADLGSKLTEIVPICSGESFGPIDYSSTLKVLDVLMYPSRSQGFLSVSPSVTGAQTSVTPDILSKKIHNYVRTLVGYSKCRGAFFDQKALWAVTLPGGSVNTFVLMYDNLKKVWSRLSGWAVCDWGVLEDSLIYLDAGTGDVFEALNRTYNDNNNPYECFAFTKRYNWGALSMPKTQDVVYLEGLMTPASEFFVDVMFNENGEFKTQTFKINKDTPNLSYSQPLTNAQGQFIFGQPAFAWVILSEVSDISAFRCYLGVSNRHGYYNIQLKVYSNCASFYLISGIGMDPQLSKNVPPEMVINPVLAS